ncbi:hypothetical protein HDU99_001902 [Rhizoclosmatium hyalinum]|nr:hypothetical protein HDU99_001902 [Rhizoclosmatium hyalinum]
MDAWTPLPAEETGVCIIPYDAERNGFVSLSVGDVVVAVERSGSNWFRGYVFGSADAQPLADRAFQLGVFPAAHVTLLKGGDGGGDGAAIGGGVNTNSNSNSNTNSNVGVSDGSRRIPPPPHSAALVTVVAVGAAEPLVADLAAVLVEWAALLKKHLVAQDYALYSAVQALSLRLYAGRQQLLASALSKERMIRLRSQLVDTADLGNHLQGLDSIARHRTRGYLLGERNNAVKLFKTHFETYERLRLCDKSLSVYAKLYDRIATSDRLTLSLSPLSIIPSDTSSKDTLLTLIPTTRKRNSQFQTYYLHFELSACFAQICLPGEYAELVFSIYNKRTQTTVSEDFVVRIDYTGMPVSADLDGRLRLKTVFCEVSDPESTAVSGSTNDTKAADISSGALCLVVKIVKVSRSGSESGTPPSSSLETFLRRNASNSSLRLSLAGGNSGSNSPAGSRRGSESLFSRPSLRKRGSMSLESLRAASKNDSSSIPLSSGLRRPFAVGVLELTDSWNKAKKHGFADTNAVLESSVAVAQVAADSDAIIAPPVTSIGEKSLMEGVEHTIQLFTPNSEAAFSALPDQILKHQPGETTSQENIKVVLNLSAHTCSITEPVPVSLVKVGSTPRLGFFDRIHPNDSRNSIYVTLQAGDFVVKGPTFSQRNVQCIIQVRTSDGGVIESCLSRGFARMETSFESIVYHHVNSPVWNETVRVDLDPQTLEDAHLILLFRQCNTSAMDGAGGLAAGSGGGEKGLFAFGFLPFIRQDSTVVLDQQHTLNLYKYDKLVVQSGEYLKWLGVRDGTSLGMAPGSHILVPPSTATLQQQQNLLLRDKVTIRTQLCSTLMTQSTGILNLLHWRQSITYFRVPVSARISDFSDQENTVFLALVHVFGVLNEDRFSGYEVALETYVDKFLRSTGCWRGILATFMVILNQAYKTAGTGDLKLLGSSVKVWGIWIQLVVRSGLMDQKLGKGVTDGDRKLNLSDSISEMVDKLCEFVRLPSVSATEIQVLVLTNFMELVPYLERVFGVVDLMPKLICLVDSVNVDKPILNTYKLAFIHSLIRSPIFNDFKSRLALVNSTKRWILDYISADLFRDLDSSKIATFRLSLSVIAELIEKLHKIGDRLEKDIGKSGLKSVDLSSRNELLTSCVNEVAPLLDHLIRLYGSLIKLVKGANFDRVSALSAAPLTGANFLQAPFRTELAELSAVIVSFVNFLPQNDLLGVLKIDIETYSAGSKVSGIGGLYQVMQSLLRGDAFPENWASANMVICKVVIKVMRVVNEHLRALQQAQSPLLEGAVSAQTQLFLLDYFSILLQLLNSRAIATEYFRPQLARLAHRLDADVRGEAGELFRFAWKEVIMAEKVDRSSISFIRSLFGPFLELTMSPHSKLKYAAIELLFSIIEHECKSKGDFNSLEAECLDRLEGLIMVEGKGDQVFRHFFVDAMGKYFTEAAASSAVTVSLKVEDDSTRGQSNSRAASINTNVVSIGTFATAGARFLKSVDTLMDICITLRDIPSDSRYNDEKIWMTLKLMHFFRDTGRRGLYVRYIHTLSDLHSSLGNTAESVLALKLHGDLLPWSHDEQLEPLPQYGFPVASSAFERKEQIWLACLNGLESTNNWERAIVLYTELGSQYEKKWFNYSNYALILRKQADLIENIMTKERYFPTYYRVGFYGKGHPNYLQGKQFIYKGGEWEKLASFCESILNKFVGSQLLKSNAPPSDEIVHGTGSWIQITSVNPEIDRQRWADGDINFAWYNWEYESERLSEVGASTSIRNSDIPESVHEGESALISLSGNSQRKSAALTSENTSNSDIKYLIEPDLDPDLDSLISKANILLDSIPAPVRSYYSSNEINSFSYSRPFRRAASVSNDDSGPSNASSMMDPIKDLTDLWIEKTLFLTADTFPCLSQRSRVAKSFTIHLSPIENAIIAVRSKTRQLAHFLKQFEETESAEPQNINNFTLALNGAVDAPVNGGIPMYRNAFLGENSVAYNANLVKMLVWSIEKQVETLHTCLGVHGKLIGAQMRPLHDSLISMFFKNFGEEISKLDLPSIDSSGHKSDEFRSAALRRSPSTAFLSRRPLGESNMIPPYFGVTGITAPSVSSSVDISGTSERSGDSAAAGRKVTVGSKIRNLFK